MSFYDSEEVEEELFCDALDAHEEGFMRGYLAA